MSCTGGGSLLPLEHDSVYIIPSNPLQQTDRMLSSLQHGQGTSVSKPIELTDNIMHHRRHAMAVIKHAKTDPIVLSRNTQLICSRLDRISSMAGLNTVHVRALICSVSQLWVACAPALASAKDEQSRCRKAMQGCMTQLLHVLQPLLPQLSARQASSTLKSLAMLRMPLDAVAQKTAVELTFRVDANEATPQDLAGAISALAEWQRHVPGIPVTAKAVQALYKRFATFGDQHFHKGAATSQDVLHFLLKAAKLPIRPDAATLNAICAHMIALDQQSAAEQLSAPSIAIMIRTLSQMRYLPEPPHIAYLLEQFATSCTVSPPLQPGLADIRHVLSALSRLGSIDSCQVVRRLGVQVLNTARTGSHTLCSVVRSMAALDVLDLDMFVQFLDILSTHSGNSVYQPHLTQISQVLYKLEPLPQDSRAMHVVWEGVSLRVQALGCLQPRHERSADLHGGEALHRSLAQLQLVHRSFVTLSGYSVGAVLDQKSPRSGPLILTILHQADKLMNKPDRYTIQSCAALLAGCNGSASLLDCNSMQPLGRIFTTTKSQGSCRPSMHHVVVQSQAHLTCIPVSMFQQHLACGPMHCHLLEDQFACTQVDGASQVSI